MKGGFTVKLDEGKVGFKRAEDMRFIHRKKDGRRQYKERILFFVFMGIVIKLVKI